MRVESLEFGITDKSGKNNYTAPRTRGSIIVFPAFLSHRVTPVTKGKRYSLITWMLEIVLYEDENSTRNLSTMVN